MFGDYMNNLFENKEEVFNSCISGFHIYEIEKPYLLSYISDSLCTMLGYGKEELADSAYETLIHISDKKIYSDFINDLS